MAEELRHYNVRVSVVSPGGTGTRDMRPSPNADLVLSSATLALPGPGLLPYDCPMGRSKKISGSTLTHNGGGKNVTKSRLNSKQRKTDLIGSKSTHIPRDKKIPGSPSSGKRSINELTGPRLTRKKRTISDSSQPVTFAQLADVFFDEQRERLSPASLIRLRSMLKRFRTFFLDTTNMASITEDQVRAFVRQRRRETSAGALRLEVGALKHVFRTAIERSISSTDPSCKVVVPREKIETHYLTQDEFWKVLDFCPHFLKPIVLLSAGSGMSRQEVLRARWVDVDEKNWVIRIPKSRGRASREIPLSDLAKGALQMAKSSACHSSVRIFTGRQVNGTNLSVEFLRACRRAKVPNVSFKDLRHTAARFMVEQGVSIANVAAYLGHRSAQAAVRYFDREYPLTEAAKAIDFSVAPAGIPRPPRGRRAQ